MQAYVIKPNSKAIESVEFDGKLDTVKALIGFDSIEVDEIDTDGNVLYFDENCFIRDSSLLGRFKMSGLAPIAGVGVVINCANPKDPHFSNPTFSLDQLKSKIQFIE
jgi:hypothetical protein